MTQFREGARRTHIEQITGNLRDGVVIIEIDGAISWANAAALAMHGDIVLGQLGGDVTGYHQRYELRYRNGHELAADEYPANRALRGEVFKDVVVDVTCRGGDRPQWTHKVSYLSIIGEPAERDFVVLTFDDATDVVRAEQRFEDMFAANPAPAVICRLADLRFIKVNRGFLEMTGYQRDTILGRSVYEIDVLEQAERRQVAIANLERGATIPQMEAELTLPGGGTKHVIVAGHPIEINEQACMLFTFVDLEHRKRAEITLRQSEERFARAFQLSPVPMLISNLSDRRILDANEAFVREFGHERSNAIGRSKAELRLWADAEMQTAIEQQLQQTGRVQSAEVILHTLDGQSLDCLLSSEGVTILNEQCVLTVIQNVSARRRTDLQLSAAVEAVMQDSSWLGQKIVAKINSYIEPLQGVSIPSTEELSCRERQVIALIAQGATDKAIAAVLKVSVNTVKNHVRGIYRKTGVHKRAEAVVWARHRGLVNHAVEQKKKS